MHPTVDSGPPIQALLATGAAIAVAAALVLVGLLLGLVGPGDLGQPVESGRPVTVTGAPRMVWASEDVLVTCDPDRAEVPASWMNTRGQGFTNRGRHGVAMVSADTAGEVTWTCTATSPATLSIGTPPLLHDMRWRLFGMLGVLLLAALALALGVSAAVVRRPT